MTYVTSFAEGLQLSLIEHEIIELYKIFSVLGLGRHICHIEKLQSLYDEIMWCNRPLGRSMEYDDIYRSTT